MKSRVSLLVLNGLITWVLFTIFQSISEVLVSISLSNKKIAPDGVAPFIQEQALYGLLYSILFILAMTANRLIKKFTSLILFISLVILNKLYFILIAAPGLNLTLLDGFVPIYVSGSITSTGIIRSITDTVFIATACYCAQKFMILAEGYDHE